MTKITRTRMTARTRATMAIVRVSMGISER
jgi:hypothetical protein